MKKNIFIVVLVLLVVGLGGYLVYDKVIDKDVDKKVENKSEEDYDISEAKKLVDKYYTNYCYDNFFSKGLNDNIKFLIAFQNLKQGDIRSDVVDSFENEEIKSTFQEGTLKYIEYNTLLDSAKTLFGEDTTIEKKKYISCPGFQYLNTSTKGEIFVDISQCGCGPGFIESYEVLSAKHKENTIEIIVGYIKIASDMNEVFVLDGKEYTQEIPKEVLSNYIKSSDNIDKFKLIFKQEKEHYYLDSVSKLNK